MITIFTEPSLNPFFNLFKDFKNLVKKFIGRKILPYSGHYAVVRSILKGLDELGVNYNYNPRSKNEIGSHVHVLAGVTTLEMAIRLKKNQTILRLTAGPNIVISSNDNNGIVGSPEIDLYTVNSEWTKQAYIQDNPKLRNRIEHWHAGVDEKFWQIEKLENKTSEINFLLYLKRPIESMVSDCKILIEKYGYNWQEIKYGHYTIEELKEKLEETDIVLYFVEQESQGIAMFEIWATNTPTWHWDPGYWQYKMKNYKSSSAPYISIETGRKFRDEKEFEKLLNSDTDLEQYNPCDWILNNATDKLAALNFLKTLKYEDFR